MYVSLWLACCAAIGIVGLVYASKDEIRSFERELATCELEALRLGTDVADLFNAPVGNEDWEVRIQREGISHKLAFAPKLSSSVSGTPREVHNVSDSVHTNLDDKWLYMLGDSTTRQIWATIGAPLHGRDFERRAKEWTRGSCTPQTHRQPHPAKGDFPAEGWQGSCGLNEVTCHVPGFGTQGKLTFDWKHFPYEDYDEFVFGSSGPFIAGFDSEGTRKPDVLAVQFGLHTCWHAVPEGYNSQHLQQTNEEMIEAHLQKISQLMHALRAVVDGYTKSNSGSHMLVIIVTSGGAGMGAGGLRTDACVQRFNREGTRLAHQFGFPVLDRGEIEHRLMVKSSFTKHPILGSDLHLPHPAPELIATCLLQLISCMQTRSSFRKVTAEVLALR